MKEYAKDYPTSAKTCTADTGQSSCIISSHGLFLYFLQVHPYLKSSLEKFFSSFCSFLGVSKATSKQMMNTFIVLETNTFSVGQTCFTLHGDNTLMLETNMLKMRIRASSTHTHTHTTSYQQLLNRPYVEGIHYIHNGCEQVTSSIRNAFSREESERKGNLPSMQGSYLRLSIIHTYKFCGFRQDCKY